MDTVQKRLCESLVEKSLIFLEFSTLNSFFYVPLILNDFLMFKGQGQNPKSNFDIQSRIPSKETNEKKKYISFLIFIPGGNCVRDNYFILIYNIPLLQQQQVKSETMK